jgi:hypothetical protein
LVGFIGFTELGLSDRVVSGFSNTVGRLVTDITVITVRMVVEATILVVPLVGRAGVMKFTG